VTPLHLASHFNPPFPSALDPLQTLALPRSRHSIQLV